MFTAKSLVDSQLKNPEKKSNGLSTEPDKELVPIQFIETICGVQDTTAIKFGNKDFLIAGLEDGTVALLDLTGTNEKSYKRPIFKM